MLDKWLSLVQKLNIGEIKLFSKTAKKEKGLKKLKDKKFNAWKVI